MKKLNIGINGFGRIGRIAARIILNRQQLSLTAINSRASSSSHAYLLKYDSTYGILPNKIESVKNFLKIDKQKVDILSIDNPTDIPWEKSGVDIVIDATGKFRTISELAGHLNTKTKYVILSSPAKDSIKTFVLGVNENQFQPKADKIISNSSCTTNCLATTLKVINDNFQVVRGFMITIHAVTDSQNLLDNSHKKEIRLRRAAFASIIPSSTGSAKDIGKLFPELNGKIFCRSIRVPLLTVSLINLSIETRKKTTVEEVNQAFQEAAEGKLKGILSVAKEELVSKDFTGDMHSSIVDPFLTQVVDGNLVNIYAWYDNEWGYTSRLIDMVEFVAKKGKLL